MFSDRNLKSVAAEHGATPAQIALAWVLREPDIIAIPKAGQPQHIRENRAALDIELTPEDLAKLDKSFPPPKRKTPLEML
jgi:diketogulonate reductase-like aldo/keto reductase